MQITDRNSQLRDKEKVGEVKIAHVSSITLSDGTILELEQDEIVVLVGPNSSGKSSLLRGVKDKLNKPLTPNAVVKSLCITKSMPSGTYLSYLSNLPLVRVEEYDGAPHFAAYGQRLHINIVKDSWELDNNSVGHISRWLCHYVSGGERLELCKPARNYEVTAEGPAHPIQMMYQDDAVEAKISRMIRDAFGCDLIVHRSAGNTIPLYVGERPKFIGGENATSTSYARRLELLPKLTDAGDGLKSYVGLLLATMTGVEPILLIDEPEAFLHPPQAKMIGRVIAGQMNGRQIFIATHSTHILQGILESRQRGIKVIRLTRDGDVNHAHVVDRSQIDELWKDPLLRFSNVFDALFHEQVVICEADGDCRFYSAMLGAITSEANAPSRTPDVMFVSSGGNDRIPMIARALIGLGVSVRVVVDFDVLSERKRLQSIVESMGVDWEVLSADWNLVYNSIADKRCELQGEDVKRDLAKLIDAIPSGALTKQIRDELSRIVRQSSPWSLAKSMGKNFVPSGEPTKACDRLLKLLAFHGIHVVPVGELECFDKTTPGHGPAWVNAVVGKDMNTDPSLRDARDFASELFKSIIVQEGY